MRFAERMGFVDLDFLQINVINNRLRNRIWNLVNSIINDPAISFCNELIAEVVLDRCGMETNDYYDNMSTIKSLIQNTDDEYDWFMPYEVLEAMLDCLEIAANSLYLSPKNQDEGSIIQLCERFENKIKKIMKEEKSGYRLLNGKFVAVTSEEELEAIDDSMKTLYSSVNQHMQKAIEAFSSKINPDYESTIKNAISAVESMCSIIIGKDKTLNEALKQLENNGVKIHPALKDAFIKLYAYTSDETGIRHGGIDFQNVPQEDAKYMLITCSAFINYLVEKYNNCGLGGNNNDLS